MQYTDISSVTFARSVACTPFRSGLIRNKNSVGGALPSARTFDLLIKLRSAATAENITFSAMQKEELEGIEDFLKMKKIRVKNEMEELAAAVDTALGQEDSDDEMAVMAIGEENDEDSESMSFFFLCSNSVD